MNKCLSVVMLAGLSCMSLANAASEAGSMSLTVVTPVTVAETSVMSFGAILKPTASTLVTLQSAGSLQDPAHSASATGRQAGVMRITGTPGVIVTIGATHVGGSCDGGLTLFGVSTSIPGATIPGTGFVDVDLGATVIVPSTAEGSFTCTYPVTVDYF